MAGKLEVFRNRPGKDFSKAVKMALKNIPFQAHESMPWPHSQLWAEQQPDGASGAGLVLVNSAAGTDCSSKHCAYLIGE